MAQVCTKVLNGTLPQRAQRWAYSHKIVPFSKMSHHQADIEAREQARVQGLGDTYEAPVRPIAIGDGLLRLENIVAMPQKAQKVLSESVTANAINVFESELAARASLPALERLWNWRSVQGKHAGRWVEATPWQTEGYLSISNSLYAVAFARRYRLPRPAQTHIAQRQCNCAQGHKVFLDEYGDHQEANCRRLNRVRTLVHDQLCNLIMQLMIQGGLKGIRLEYRQWDPSPIGKCGTRRVPDVVGWSADGQTEYVVDARISWSVMSDSSTGGAATYEETGDFARQGEKDKWRNWRKAVKRAREQGRDESQVKFVPFSLEIGGVWGPAAEHFFKKMASHRRNLRDIDYFHWSSQTWQDYWLDAISVCLARGRGRIGSEVARTDMFHRQAIHSVPGSEGVAP
jgi:hypothetical protein